MMKLIFVAVLLIWAGFTYADPRIEVNANNSFCHAPWDTQNDDKEVFLADCRGIVDADGAGGANGQAIVARRVDRRAVTGIRNGEIELVDIGRKFVANVTVSNGNSEFTCTLVESNNTEYTTGRYVVRTHYEFEKNEKGIARVIGKATYRILCLDANNAEGD